MDADWTAFWKRMPFRSLRLLGLYERLRFRTYKRMLAGIAFDDIVDLGGGSGTMAKMLAEQFDVPGIVVDNNPAAYRIYRRMGRSPRTRYVRKDLFAYARKHDVVISDGLIEHFPRSERKRLLRHHKRLAKKYVLIFVPKKDWHVRAFLRFKHGHEENYTRERLIAEVKSVGLRPIRTASDFHMHGVLCKVKGNL